MEDFRLEVAQRLSALETTAKHLISDSKATRQGVEDLSNKIDTLLRPLSDAVAGHSADISWLKDWVWKNLGAASASGGIVGLTAEWIVRHWHQ